MTRKDNKGARADVLELLEQFYVRPDMREELQSYLMAEPVAVQILTWIAANVDRSIFPNGMQLRWEGTDPNWDGTTVPPIWLESVFDDCLSNYSTAWRKTDAWQQFRIAVAQKWANYTEHVLL